MKGQIADNNELYYIRKHGAYYGYDFSGYVNQFINAGVYTREQAESCCTKFSDLSMELIDIDRHNNEIESRIKDLLRLKICKV